jgi:AraC family transcriptional activator of mtrCDE
VINERSVLAPARKPSENLDRLLATMEVAVRRFVAWDVAGGKRVEAAPLNAILVHYVLGGTVALNRAGEAARICPAGTMILTPPGLEISLMCAAGDARVASGLVFARLSSTIGLLDHAQVLVIEDVSDAPMIQLAWETMVGEAGKTPQALGTVALVSTLMKACILTVLCRFFQRPGITPRIIGALADPRLASAVASILHEPGAPHSVERLAQCAGLSRSTFARQFSQVLGSAPMVFVARTRLHHAARMLRSSRMSIKTIAASAGFSSRSHFSRTFREAYGSDPRAYRQNAAEPDVTDSIGPMFKAESNVRLQSDLPLAL